MPELIFVGPCGARSASCRTRTAAQVLLPPVARGMLPAALRDHRPHRVTLVDGAFYQTLAIDHREIMGALDQGVDVVGLGSMGALRAVELAPTGMQGFGAVFELFRDHRIDDDEVMITHSPAPPFAPLGIALIEARVALGHAVATGLLDHDVAADLIAALKTTWFADRSLALLRRLLAARHRDPIGIMRFLTAQLAGPAALKSADYECYRAGVRPPAVQWHDSGLIVLSRAS